MNTPLHDAVRKGDLKQAKRLLTKRWFREVPDVNAVNDSGCTALHLAAGLGREELVELLVGNGTDTNISGVKQYTALHWAATLGHRGAASLLLAHGADVNAKDSEGFTPLHVSSGYRNNIFWEQADLMIDTMNTSKDTWDPIESFEKVLRGQKDVAEVLLDKGAEVNARSKDDLTPLHIAAGTGQLLVMNLLLRAGGEIEARDNKGRTALHFSAITGNKSVAERLLAVGAELEVRTPNGGTPLHWAVGTGHSNVAEFLLSKGADVNAQDNDGDTPLWVAYMKRHDLMPMLRKWGAKDERVPPWVGR
jgi:cytohesin